MSVNSPIPIFIISCNRLNVLRKAIESYRNSIKAPIQLIIHDNSSTYEPLLSYLEEIKNDGALVYKSKEIVDSDEKLNNVAITIQEWFSRHDAPYYIVTDPDIALDSSGGDIIELYAYFLDLHPEINVVGPMWLRIDDIPDYYPLKNEVIRRHTKQFWHKTPHYISWKDSEIAYQDALIDTTFGMYRGGYKFQRLSKGFRVYEPYWARHLDWYINPNEMTDDQVYYMENASRVSHWGGLA